MGQSSSSQQQQRQRSNHSNDHIYAGSSRSNNSNIIENSTTSTNSLQPQSSSSSSSPSPQQIHCPPTPQATSTSTSTSTRSPSRSQSILRSRPTIARSHSNDRSSSSSSSTAIRRPTLRSRLSSLSNFSNIRTRSNRRNDQPPLDEIPIPPPPPTPPQEREDQAQMLSRLLSVAAAATAASLIGSMEEQNMDTNFESFLRALQNGTLATTLDEELPSLNFFRMFRFNNNNNSNNNSNNTTSNASASPINIANTNLNSTGSPSNATNPSNNNNNNMVPIIIVGIRSVSNGASSEDSPTPPFLEALANLPVNMDEPDPSSRSWIIYVLGSSYPENHPILSTPSLFTESPTYEDMLLLSSILGPAKPPVADKKDVENSGGLISYSSTACAEKRCTICLTDFEEGEQLRKLGDCSHFFHRECIDCWLLNGRNSCPLCRGVGVKNAVAIAGTESTPSHELSDLEVLPTAAISPSHSEVA